MDWQGTDFKKRYCYLYVLLIHYMFLSETNQPKKWLLLLFLDALSGDPSSEWGKETCNTGILETPSCSDHRQTNQSQQKGQL